MFCTKCGHYNPESSIFCARCGMRFDQEDASLGETAVGLPAVETESEEEVEFSLPPEPLEAGNALLVIKKGPDAGMSFTINREVIVVGRHPESDIFLDDITVSRKHAEIRREGNTFRLLDTGSLNGTYLNHERIETSSLGNGDEIQIGKFRLLFFTGAG
ncbi:MAG: zinc-ribbon and FHA domain-containing protein [Actinobacteria bacterium]|nr:zinc-ribbon and FHA domain-containing protein [Actinomycetota bacterium]